MTGGTFSPMTRTVKSLGAPYFNGPLLGVYYALEA